ncbi:MAG TPA: TRAP transporter substrate-binding protein [Devosia sp.]|jgi:TRAP-type mannitol/chloroaromatic compound transport system substrate-binding protein|uniref:TRAP transporter substrate-binding protein n=1 Tax=Devosia sp. TaxID=1871048 RepID=UPI002DDCCB40|nr:TRAP transporter substrate-binding protein [Devosia sp.]HEV2514560.1 TRAP transporter substrate-binding protein [Devosia sp.]
MKRREFFKSATAMTASVAAATTLAAPAIAQGNITWRMVTTWPKNFPGLGVGAQNLADRITAASGGRLTVQVFAAGEMVPPLQSLDAVIDGSAEMSHGAAYYWQNKSQGLSFYTGVPYGMTSRELTAWVRFLGGQEIWDEIYDQFGVQGFLSGDTGTQAGGWFKNELTGVADIQGLRFRTPGLGGQTWAKLGAAVTNMAAGEIFAALQSGTLDAAEFVGPYNDLALGFYQIAKNYYFPSFVEPGLATELVVSKAKFQALPEDLQAIVKGVTQAAYDDVASDMYANDPRALQALVSEHGVQVRQFPEEILEAGAKAASEIIADIRSNGDALTKKVAESYVSAFNLLRTRTEGTDMPFLAARQKYFTFS